jgi:phosphatidylglycerophosphatase C
MNPINPIVSRESVRLSLFDFDGTLCRLNSWRVFLRWLLARGNFASIRVAFAIALRRTRIMSASALKDTALSCLRGFTVSEVNELGAQIYDKYLRPNLLPRALAELKKCQSEGYRVIVLSGAFDFLLRPFCAEHGIEDCLCTRLLYEGDRCLGKLADREIRGEYKRVCLERYLGDEVIAWDQSSAYADELKDFPILHLVKNGFIVGSSIARSISLPPGISYGPW